ncbi:MAG: hypothetical protein IJ929_06435 [Prevotella sp.]|nr:hypothetical protein [Prevotella sp.]
MKKLFTLLGVVLMASTAFGQTNWTSVIVNGDFEGTVPSYEAWATAPDYNQDYDFSSLTPETWNSFWVHEWPGDQTKQLRGTTTIVEDPADPTNHCAKVVIRSRAEGEAAGNLTKDYTGNPGTYGSWDCQFFIYATQPIPAGKEIRLQLKVKAEREGTFETQNHSLPGTYIDANAYGTPKYTTEWQTLKLSEFTVSEDQANAGFQSIAFNLCTDEDANVLYLDDIKLQIRDPKTDDGDAGAWINFMRKGIYSMDNIKGVGIVDGKEQPFECTNYTFQDLNKPAGEQQQPAPVVEVPGEAGVMAVHIPVRGYYIKEVEDLDEDGNQQFDDETGEVKMKSVYYWSNGDSIGTSAPARWTCQFFVSTLHKMVPGEKYRFKFRCKADKPTSLGTQCHYGPGQYQSYNTFGDESAFPVGTDWTTFELGDFEQNTSKTIPSSVAKPQGNVGCQTITFDCVPLEGDDNNFYLIVDEFSFTEKYVLDADRTLGTPQDIVLPVSAGDDEKAVQIDAAPMLNTFEVEDFSFLNNGKDGIKLFKLKAPDDPEDDPIESFSTLLPWTDGGFVGADGQVIDGENGINIRFNDETIDGTKIDLCTWNNLDSKNIFADGNTVKTKLAVSQSGWYYVYNITLMSDKAYEDYLAGIKDVQVIKSNNGAIYDLMGRKVSKPGKGLYIVNGKKYFQK